MSPLWIAVLVLGAPPVGQTATADHKPAPVARDEAAIAPSTPNRTGSALRDAVKAALRHWARPSDGEAAQAAREFIALYQQLQADNQLPPSQREALRIQVRNRLVQLSDQIATKVARQTLMAERKRPGNVGLPVGQGAPLAQLGGPRAGMGNGMIGGFGPGALPGAQNGNTDNGQQLIDLIQKVISPNSWDVNGGPGTIYYWRPGRAMVVRQTAEVHEQLVDMLEQLGRANR